MYIIVFYCTQSNKFSCEGVRKIHQNVKVVREKKG